MSVQIISSNIPTNSTALDRSSSYIPPPITSAGTSPPERLQSSEIQLDSLGPINRAYQSLSENTTQINQVADSVRQADSALQKVGHTIDMMKGTLEGIIKNYPPFPPGSEQRVKALKGFAALRNEIEKMTFPSDPGLMPKLISDPAKSSGSFSVTLDSQGTSGQLHRQQVDAGPNGLNIPILPIAPPADSGDGPIHHAISVLKTAANTVSFRRQSLSENFVQQALPAVVASLTSQAGLSGASQGKTALSEQAALSVSRGISTVFSAIPVGMSVTRSSILKGLT